MFTNILVPVDLTHKEQLPRLIEAASLLVDKDQGEICLLYVDPILVHHAGFPQIEAETFKAHEQEARQQLQSLIDGLPQERLKVTYTTREGSPHEEILEEAKERNADAILMMSGRPGLASYFIGSNAERVVRHADCSVFVIRN